MGSALAKRVITLCRRRRDDSEEDMGLIAEAERHPDLEIWKRELAQKFEEYLCLIIRT